MLKGSKIYYSFIFKNYKYLPVKKTTETKQDLHLCHSISMHKFFSAFETLLGTL